MPVEIKKIINLIDSAYSSSFLFVCTLSNGFLQAADVDNSFDRSLIVKHGIDLGIHIWRAKENLENFNDKWLFVKNHTSSFRDALCHLRDVYIAAGSICQRISEVLKYGDDQDRSLCVSVISKMSDVLAKVEEIRDLLRAEIAAREECECENECKSAGTNDSDSDR